MAAEELRKIDKSADVGARLDRGELTVDEYMDVLVEQAVAVVAGKVPADRLDWLRGMMREQLYSDPVLRERVRQATGHELQTT
ncbi:MAG: hypothetical protein ABIQ16_15615 [Polyangiaceae bacterium]